MMTESPIKSANDLMRSIASAMDALLAYWELEHPTADQIAAIKNVADFIDVSFVALRDAEADVREYVGDAWNDIMVNDLLRFRISTLASTCKAFYIVLINRLFVK